MCSLHATAAVLPKHEATYFFGHSLLLLPLTHAPVIDWPKVTLLQVLDDMVLPQHL